MFFFVLAVLIYLYFNKSQTSRKWPVAIIFQLFLVAFGWCYTGIGRERVLPDLADSVPGRYIVEIREVSANPQGGYRVVGRLKYRFTPQGWSHDHRLLLLTIPGDADFEPLSGQWITIKGKILQVPAPTNPGEFNYRDYLLNRGIIGKISLNALETSLLKQSKTNDLKTFSENLRNFLLKQFRNYRITGDEYAVLSALVLGYRSSVQDELMQAYSVSGAMHVLSVSGLHVGIIYLMVEYLLRLLRKRKSYRLLRIITGLTFLWFYAFVTGCSPPVLRATVMFSFLLIGTSLNRPGIGLNSLAASAFFILLLNPMFIRDIGFQLSYTAVAFIMILHKPLYSLLSFRYSWADKIWSLTALSLVAQAGTFPLGFLYFHQFPNYFLLTNLVVVPLSGLILYASMAFLFLCWIPFLSDGLAFCIKWMVRLLNESVLLVEQIPFSAITRIPQDIPGLIILYGIVLSLAAGLIRRQYSWLLISMFFCTLFISRSLFRQYVVHTQEQLTVYNIPGKTAVDLVVGRKCTFLSGSGLHGNPWLVKMKAEPYRISRSFRQEKEVILDSLDEQAVLTGNVFVKKIRDGVTYSRVQENSIVFLRNPSYHLKIQEGIPFRIDYLVIGGKSVYGFSDILLALKPGKVISDSSVPVWLDRKLSQTARKAGYTYYSVRDKGAFIENLDIRQADSFP
ncbi:MAG: ComEC/Rec2 family competence protein [Bacteroidales bacterium]